MKKRKTLSLSARSAWTSQAFILPFYIGFLLFFLGPLVESIKMSFSNVSITNAGGYTLENIGFENYRRAFLEDANFGTNITNSFTQMLWQVPVIIVLSLFLALIINQKFRGRIAIRAIFFLPVIFASGVVLEVIGRDAVAGSALSGSVVSSTEITQSTALKDFLTNAGFSDDIIKICTTISSNLFGMVWRSGIQMIIFLAGLQSIPPTLYEASSIEGATAWENFWKITLPMLVPSMMINIVYTIIDTFTDATNSVMNQITNMISSSVSKYGLASSFAWSYFLFIGIILIFVFLIFRVVNKKFN